jgi:hypothetical protein
MVTACGLGVILYAHGMLCKVCSFATLDIVLCVCDVYTCGRWVGGFKKRLLCCCL